MANRDTQLHTLFRKAEVDGISTCLSACLVVDLVVGWFLVTFQKLHKTEDSTTVRNRLTVSSPLIMWPLSCF